MCSSTLQGPTECWSLYTRHRWVTTTTFIPRRAKKRKGATTPAKHRESWPLITSSNSAFLSPHPCGFPVLAVKIAVLNGACKGIFVFGQVQADSEEVCPDPLVG